MTYRRAGQRPPIAQSPKAQSRRCVSVQRNCHDIATSPPRQGFRYRIYGETQLPHGFDVHDRHMSDLDRTHLCGRPLPVAERVRRSAEIRGGQTGWASSTTSAVNAASSSGVAAVRVLGCVDRCSPKARHDRLSKRCQARSSTRSTHAFGGGAYKVSHMRPLHGMNMSSCQTSEAARRRRLFCVIQLLGVAKATSQVCGATARLRERIGRIQ